MNDIWQVDYYESPAGNKPIEEFGIRLGLPRVKIIGTPLWELRILGSDSIRIFYIAKEQKHFFLLHGFKKKTQKTNRGEIKIAIERLHEYESRRRS